MAKERTQRFEAEHYLPEVQAYITTKGPSTNRDIATLLGLSVGGTTAMLQRLVERGYLRSEQGGGPTSTKSYSLTKTSNSKTVGMRFDQDKRIAQAAEILFDLTKVDVLSLLQWAALTKEMM